MRIFVFILFSYLCCGYYSVHMQRNYKSTSKERAFTSSELNDSPLFAEVSLFNTMETKDLKENFNYYVTSEGDVYSKYWHRGRDVKKLTPRATKRGYLKVHFYVEGIETNRSIHRLVAEAFIPNPYNLPQVNHKDLDKTNNHDWNLEWCTNAENNEHAVINGAKVKGSKHGFAKFTEQEILQVRVLYVRGKFGVPRLAKLYNVDQKTMYEIINRITWKHI